jgi:hypothetical protein
MMNPLIAEAMKKAAIVWLHIEHKQPVLIWTVWANEQGTCYVLFGGMEQQIPGLTNTAQCQVMVRSSDNGAHILTWEANVHQLEPDSAEWDAAVSVLLPKRLNLPDTPTAPQRWAKTSHIAALAPL